MQSSLYALYVYFPFEVYCYVSFLYTATYLMMDIMILFWVHALRTLTSALIAAVLTYDQLTSMLGQLHPRFFCFYFVHELWLVYVQAWTSWSKPPFLLLCMWFMISPLPICEYSTPYCYGHCSFLNSWVDFLYLCCHAQYIWDCFSSHSFPRWADFNLFS